jgi:hypothetical protein
MARPSGLPKTGGRKTGTPNRKTAALKSIVDELGLDVPSRLRELLPNLSPEKQADVLLDLMSYLYPKRKAIEHSGPDGSPIQIQPNRENLKRLIADPETFSALQMIEGKLKESSDESSPGNT